MEKETGNVIQFPHKGKFPLSEKQVSSNVNMVKYTHINETLGTIIPILFSNIEIAGFDVSSDEDDFDYNVKDGSLIVESIRSILCKHYGLYHPFQDIADNIFKKENDGGYSIVDNITLEFQKPEEDEEGNSES